MFYLISDKEYHRYPHNDEILEALGLARGQHIPDEHKEIEWLAKMKTGELTYTQVVQLTKAEASALHPRSTKPRRIHARCPKCSRLVCAGHTFQHRC